MGRREWYRSIAKGDREDPGCMSGMLQFFDFHHILFTPRGSKEAQISSPQLHPYASQLKGVEAPRNSLELDDASAARTTSTASALAEEYYGIPIGIQVNARPSLEKNKKKDLLVVVEEEENRSSQFGTPRTPSVVARLMGLEILADGSSTPTLGFKSQDHSPKVSGKKKMSQPSRQPLQKRDNNLLPNVRLEMGSRSLPDTPRASSERSRDGDPRLSLQLNKENNNRNTHFCEAPHSLPPSPTGAYTNKPRRKDSFKVQEENKSPRSHYYAREIVKQVKESIHRRGGGDASTDDHVIRSRRTTRPPTDKKVLVENESTHFTAKPSPSTSPAPQNRFFEPVKPQVPPKPPRPQSISFFKVRENVEAKPIKMSASKCKRDSCERFTERIKWPAPPSETATQSDSFKTSSSSSSPNLVAWPQKNPYSSCEKIKSSYTVTGTTKRDSSYRSPSLSPSASPSQGQALPVSTIPTQEQQQHQIGIKEQDPEFIYVKSILERAGIMSTTLVRWYSPSLPIDPFVFHQLELDLPLFSSLTEHDPLRHRCNRKLLFHLVEEILGDLLSWSPRPSILKQPKQRRHEINKELLLDRLWSQIRSFPLVNCQVIEDIDALVAGDMAEAKVRQLIRHPLVAAEVESIALEIEEDVLDSIVGEGAATLALCSKL